MLTRRDLIKSLSAGSAMMAAPGLVDAQGQPTFRIAGVEFDHER